MSTRARMDVVLPYKLARQGAGFHGQIPLDAFSRFRELVRGGDVYVDVEVAFHRDEEGRCRLEGRARTRVDVECGRCLLPQSRDLDVALELCIVASDAAAAALDAPLEPYVLDGEEVLVVDLVEDDLILSLPHQVCDEREACPYRPALAYPEPKIEAADRRNPFAALVDLVGKRG